MARDRTGWTFDRAWRKAAKWTLFALLATVVAMTVTSWFAGAVPLWTGAAGVGSYAVAAFVAAALFLDFAWFREQLCNYVCPYARFQGALTDDGSLAVAYDVKLGEPRKGAGRCIACEKCVAVCPQGIDIRQGFQLECIACARCVDACTGVMGRKGYPSLITYRAPEAQPLLRPRTIAYGGLLVALSLALVGLLVAERDLSASISRAPGTLYTVDADGFVRNTFLLRVSNDSLDPVDVTVAGLDLPPGTDLTVLPIHVDAAGQAVAPVVVRMPPGTSDRRTLPLTLTVATDRTRILVDTTFKTGG
ncbi:MAG: 4Fe-4S dicluster domain-containing protein, partial [Myxococcota bacterium]